MSVFELYSEYALDEAISLHFAADNAERISNGHLVVRDDVGLLFATIEKPPNKTYCLTNRILRWVSTETNPEFYNSTILAFQSRFRAVGKPLLLFGQTHGERLYTYLGDLRVMSGEVPSSGGPESPETIIVEFDITPELPPRIWARFDWSTKPVLVNNLPLPKSLVEIIVSNRWKVPPETYLFDVFGKHHAKGMFLTPDQMERVTSQWRYLYRVGYGDFALTETNHKVVTVGSTDDGILDISQAVCLGDTGPEEPFFLDYRISVSAPRVVYLEGTYSTWKTIAPDFETFADHLAL